jgi:hypothetical protein
MILCAKKRAARDIPAPPIDLNPRGWLFALRSTGCRYRPLPDILLDAQIGQHLFGVALLINIGNGFRCTQHFAAATNPTQSRIPCAAHDET